MPSDGKTSSNRRSELQARTWIVSGHVQGVGFRWFVSRRAQEIGLTGWVRNEDDGTVQVYGVGSRDQLNQMAGYLHLGPPHASVRGVEEREAGVQQLSSFQSR
jgi:acylphosphatase